MVSRRHSTRVFSTPNHSKCVWTHVIWNLAPFVHWYSSTNKSTNDVHLLSVKETSIAYDFTLHLAIARLTSNTQRDGILPIVRSSTHVLHHTFYTWKPWRLPPKIEKRMRIMITCKCVEFWRYELPLEYMIGSDSRRLYLPLFVLAQWWGANEWVWNSPHPMSARLVCVNAHF